MCNVHLDQPVADEPGRIACVNCGSYLDERLTSGTQVSVSGAVGTVTSSRAIDGRYVVTFADGSTGRWLAESMLTIGMRVRGRLGGYGIVVDMAGDAVKVHWDAEWTESSSVEPIGK